jgi:tRNA C32,U32 (ribose-2'-O)-methylase TrmJ
MKTNTEIMHEYLRDAIHDLNMVLYTSKRRNKKYSAMRAHIRESKHYLEKMYWQIDKDIKNQKQLDKH